MGRPAPVPSKSHPPFTASGFSSAARRPVPLTRIIFLIDGLYLNTHPAEGGKLIADAVGSPMDEFKVAFEGVRVYDLKGNNEAFQGEFLKTFNEVGQIMAQLNPKEIKTIPTPQEALAIEHIKELAGK